MMNVIFTEECVTGTKPGASKGSQCAAGVVTEVCSSVWYTSKLRVT